MAGKQNLHTQWARAGAAVRLSELQQEVAEIYRAFPDLRKSGGRVAAAVSAASGDGDKKRKFSARGKKAISEGMRKYWARRKALAAKAEKAAK
jgi:hypothetical protein